MRQASLPPILTAFNQLQGSGNNEQAPRHSPSLGAPSPGSAFGAVGQMSANSNGHALPPPFVHRSSGLRQGPHSAGAFSPPQQQQHQQHQHQHQHQQQPGGSSGPDININPPPPDISSQNSYGGTPSLPHQETLGAFDSLARASPFLGDIAQRLAKLEYSVRELHAKVDAANMGRQGGNAQFGPGPDGSVGAGAHQQGQPSQGSAEEMRLLRAQVSALSSTVAQLLAHPTPSQPQNQGSPISGNNGGGGGIGGTRGILSPGVPAASQNRVLGPSLPPTQQLAGLGIGSPNVWPDFSPNPTLSIGAVAGSPMVERAISPLVGGPSAGAGATSFASSAHMLSSLDSSTSRLSPRPQGVGGPGANAANRLSWHGMPSDAPNMATARAPGSVSSKDERRWSGLGPGSRHGYGGTGHSTPQMLGSEDGRMGASNDIGGPASATASQQSGREGPPLFAPATKWEHLNLHPDLLRAIQKYGLGPPNKIQQRALPFLLRNYDIIAQAPPTQERIASYVIPALQFVLEAVNPAKGGAGIQAPAARGPYVLIVSTTVDQATQAQRMALGLGSPLGVRVHMAAAGSIDAKQEAQMLVQASPHIVVGTPAKMCELWTYLGQQQQAGGPAGPNAGVVGGEVRFVVLDEVDQLIARNLSDYVAGMLRILPMSRAAVANAANPGGNSSSVGNNGNRSNAAPSSPAVSPGISGPRHIAKPALTVPGSSPIVDRQTAIFSNTVPQDVLNFAQSINLHETVRVLVRREGTAGGAGGVQVGIGQGNGSMNAPGSTGPGSQATFASQSPAINTMPNGYFNSVAVKHGSSGTMTPGTPGAVDPSIVALRGLRQYYLWVPVSGDMSGPATPFGGPGAHGREMKLELIADLLEDMDFGHAVIYCSNAATMEAVTYKLSSKGVEAMALHRDMNHHTRMQMMAKFRTATSMFSNSSSGFGTPNMGGGPGGFRGNQLRKALVVCDLAINPKEVHQIPLVLFYDMPRTVDEYKEKVSCAAGGGMARPGVCINVVTASGGPRADIEMLRTLECHLGCKMAELPMDPRQILHT